MYLQLLRHIRFQQAFIQTVGHLINSGFINGKYYFGLQLPLEWPNLGGPLFFEHYSFLGINQMALLIHTLTMLQTKKPYLIEFVAISNPSLEKFYGYSDSCWGTLHLTFEMVAQQSSPTNDVGVI
jgi:hypothetical protein